MNRIGLAELNMRRPLASAGERQAWRPVLTVEPDTLRFFGGKKDIGDSQKSWWSRALIWLGLKQPHNHELKHYQENLMARADYQAACEHFIENHGMTVSYRVPHPKTGKFKPSLDFKRFEKAERQVLEQIFLVLHARPDLLERVPDHVHIQLFDHHQFIRRNDPERLARAGEVEHDRKRNRVMLRASVPWIYESLKNGRDGYEVISHELAHVLDLIDDNGNLTESGMDGHLPGWSEEQRRQFNRLRKKEWPKIGHNHSLFREYAGRNKLEFLAVLIENYFERPDDLNYRNKLLFRMMDDFFKIYAKSTGS